MNGVELKVERVRSNLTQKQIAERIGMTEISYNRKEQGVREFSISEVNKIAKVLNLSLGRVNEIFFDSKLTDCNIFESGGKYDPHVG